MSIATIAELITAVQDTALDHFDWCSEHDYVNEADPQSQLCRSTYALEFAGSNDRDDVTALSIDLTGSHCDLEHGFPVPLASLGFNGGFGDREIAPWKLVPIAYGLLAANARARGDKAIAAAFMDAAQGAITAHLIATAEMETAEMETAEAAEPVRHWASGPFAFVEGLDAEVDILPAPPVPQFVVAHTAAGHCEVHGVDPRYGGSVDGIDYADFDEAKRAATVLNAAKRVFDAAPVPHHYDRTAPHPRAIKDCARNEYGIEVSDEEITVAVKVVMA